MKIRCLFINLRTILVGFFFMIASYVVICDKVGAQDLFANKLQKISSIKRGNYFSEGAFFYGKKEHKNNKKNRMEVKSLRHFYSQQKKEERIVIDFTSGDYLPMIYGFVANNQKKIYIDIFNADLNTNIAGWGKGQLLKDVLFFPVDGESVSVELDFTKAFAVDVFYLEKPARLVMDVKANAKN